MVHAICIHEQTRLDFAKRIFSRELSIENRFELTDSGEMFAVTVAGMFFHAFFKTISRNKLEKLMKDAIVVHCRASYVYIEVVSALQYSAGADVFNHNSKLLPDSSDRY